MKHMLKLLGVLLLMTCVPTTYSSAYVIERDHGGLLKDYIELKDRCLTEPCEIKGVCASGCTLLVNAACVHPQARLLFHGAYIGDGEQTHMGTLKLFANTSHWPQQLYDWYYAGPFHQRGASSYTELSGAEVIAMGARSCRSSSN